VVIAALEAGIRKEQAVMRILLKVCIPNDEGNKAARNGTLGQKISEILAEQKPESVYFCDTEGTRGGYIFLKMQEASDIPKIAEPWFLAFNAKIEIHPVMIPEDLEKASPHIAEAVRKYS
jgi:hypothetical protein